MTHEEAIAQFDDLRMHYIQECCEDFNKCDAEAVRMAIEALEKQKPMKPINVYKTCDYGNISRWVCPSCSYEHRSSSSRSCGFKYCIDCGQAIDWSEV